MGLKKILALVILGGLLILSTASCRGPLPHHIPLLPERLPAPPIPPVP